MVRTQVQLTQAQVQALKRMAEQRGLSMAELIRQAIDLFLQQVLASEGDKKQKWEQAMSVVGAFRSDVPDVSLNHDEYFAQAIETYPRRTVDLNETKTKINELVVSP